MEESRKEQRRSQVRTGHCAGGEGCQAAGHVIHEGVREGEGGGRVTAPRERRSCRKGHLLLLLLLLLVSASSSTALPTVSGTSVPVTKRSGR